MSQRTNKNAATEDEIGKTHGLISKLLNMKLGYSLEMAELDKEAVDLAIDMRDVTAAIKWVEYNQITSQGANQDEETELSKNLKKIREKSMGRVIEFSREA